MLRTQYVARHSLRLVTAVEFNVKLEREHYTVINGTIMVFLRE